MSRRERAELAQNHAKVIVDRLRKSNERAYVDGAPKVAASSYKGLEATITKKLMRAGG
jgi:hypothetical protein